MIAVSALLLIAVSPELGLPKPNTMLLFEQLCIDGQAKLSSSSIKEIRYSNLPSLMKKQLQNLRAPAHSPMPGDKRQKDRLLSGQYFSHQIREDLDFIAIEERENEFSQMQRSCSVASKNISFGDAVRFLDPKADDDLSETKGYSANSTFSSRPIRWSKVSKTGYYLSIHRLNSNRVLISSVITGANEVERTQKTKDNRKQNNLNKN